MLRFFVVVGVLFAFATGAEARTSHHHFRQSAHYYRHYAHSHHRHFSRQHDPHYARRHSHRLRRLPPLAKCCGGLELVFACFVQQPTMKDRPPLGMRTWAAGRELGVAGTCVNRSVAIRDLNTILRDHGLITALTPAVQLSALSWSGDITSVRLSAEKTGNGLFKVEMTGMRSELGRALSPEQSLSEMRMPQCEYAGRSVGIQNAGSHWGNVTARTGVGTDLDRMVDTGVGDRRRLPRNSVAGIRRGLAQPRPMR